MLDVRGLSVRYGRITAVRECSLLVGEGEAVALVGHNGAGKSSILSAIAGLVRPAAGDVSFDGRSLVDMAPEQIVRTGIAMVPEGRRIFGSLTVEENLRLGATSRRDRAAVRADIERQLNRFPVLRDRLDQTAGTLSGGEQQQLAIARGLLARPKLLLLDEPSLGLAPMMVDLVFQILEELRSEGIAMLLVEQYALKAIEFADRSYVLRTGRIALSGGRDKLRSREDFADEFLGF